MENLILFLLCFLTLIAWLISGQTKPLLCLTINKVADKKTMSQGLSAMNFSTNSIYPNIERGISQQVNGKKNSQSKNGGTNPKNESRTSQEKLRLKKRLENLPQK